MASATTVPARATYADLEALPPTVKGEIIDGVLHTQPRPVYRHSRANTTIAGDLEPSFGRGHGGPGGWVILVEPGIEVPGSPEFSPDLAGWRRERLSPPSGNDRITVVPDWVCEVLSPSNRGYDVRVKRPFYARIGVAWLWFVDPEARTLVVSQLSDGRWLETLVAGDTDRVRAAPFDALELALADWW